MKTLSALVLLLLAACAGTGGRAPVEDRAVARAPAPSAAPAAQTRPAEAARQVPQAPASPPTTSGQSPVSVGAPSTSAGRAAPAEAATSYVVKPGDTLIRIALDNGQNWRDLVRWNGIENPNLIEVGQVLRVSPPSADPSSAAVAVGSAETRPVASSGRLESRPLGPSGAASAPGGSKADGPSARLEPASAAVEAAGGSSRELLEGLDWGWPAAGPMIAAFDDAKGIKGLAISGKSGDPVLAAADGRVIYAGSGLRGYGNLVIVRHNANFLSAYAHNQTLLVKEDQAVRKGQKIAEMGSSDADRVKLHFEIRRKGLPVDPSRFLPSR